MILLIRSKKLKKKEKLIESLKKTFEQRNTHELPKELEKPFMKLADDCELLIDVKGAFIELIKFYGKAYKKASIKESSLRFGFL